MSKPELNVVMHEHPIADCINLKASFGDRYRIEFEEAYYAETVDRPSEAPWLMTIPCKAGHIHPYGDSRLTAHTDRRGARKRLMEMECCTIRQLGDAEVSASFDVKDFDLVAEVMRPKKRRRLKPEQRQRLIDAGRPYRLRPTRA